MCDKLVFDLAQEVEGAPSVFVRKDWINILDNQNQSYVANQSVLDTSQLSNSNKYMSYREAYFSIPFLLTLQSSPTVVTAVDGSIIKGPATNAASPVNLQDGTNAGLFLPANAVACADSAIGLKNWFGNIIHSFTVDYNGSTIIQQTPFVNMWNSFKLMTSLSYNDVITQGCTIGFYPDEPEVFEYTAPTAYSSGQPSAAVALPIGASTATINNGFGVANNSNLLNNQTNLTTKFQKMRSGLGNLGFMQRQKWINFDKDGIPSGLQTTAGNTTYGNLLATDALNQLYKSYITRKANETALSATTSTPGVLQISVVATVYLKHIHSFFNMIPLLKGVFIKMTMNLNNSSSSVLVQSDGFAPATTADDAVLGISRISQICSNTSSALGGVNMLMLASNVVASSTNNNTANGAFNLAPWDTTTANPYGIQVTGVGAAAKQASLQKTYYLNLSVGSKCLNQEMVNRGNITDGLLSKSIFLYIPAYTFNPTFEQAYLSSPVKQIKYSDVYQYQVLNVTSGQPFNNLLTNGIANVKSVLILPFYSPSSSGTPIEGYGVSSSSNSGFLQGVPVWQSPFDPAGCGPTSPLCHLTNFNVQVSGQNAIYNLQKYNFEQFNNQLYGQNAVNGGLTDGLTSGLIDRQAFDLEYCYYYVNIERMLPVEQVVPKSIQILGTNMSSKSIDLYCFIEYGTEVAIDALTGARV
jgi:hypothetical protein